MAYMGSYYSISKAIFYLLKGDTITQNPKPRVIPKVWGLVVPRHCRMFSRCAVRPSYSRISDLCQLRTEVRLEGTYREMDM